MSFVYTAGEVGSVMRRKINATTAPVCAAPGLSPAITFRRVSGVSEDEICAVGDHGSQPIVMCTNVATAPLNPLVTLPNAATVRALWGVPSTGKFYIVGTSSVPGVGGRIWYGNRQNGFAELDQQLMGVNNVLDVWASDVADDVRDVCVPTEQGFAYHKHGDEAWQPTKTVARMIRGASGAGADPLCRTEPDADEPDADMWAIDTDGAPIHFRANLPLPTPVRAPSIFPLRALAAHGKDVLYVGEGGTIFSIERTGCPAR